MRKSRCAFHLLMFVGLFFLQAGQGLGVVSTNVAKDCSISYHRLCPVRTGLIMQKQRNNLGMNNENSCPKFFKFSSKFLRMCGVPQVFNFTGETLTDCFLGYKRGY